MPGAASDREPMGIILGSREQWFIISGRPGVVVPGWVVRSDRQYCHGSRGPRRGRHAALVCPATTSCHPVHRRASGGLFFAQVGADRADQGSGGLALAGCSPTGGLFGASGRTPRHRQADRRPRPAGAQSWGPGTPSWACEPVAGCDCETSDTLWGPGTGCFVSEVPRWCLRCHFVHRVSARSAGICSAGAQSAVAGVSAIPGAPFGVRGGTLCAG